MGTHGGDASMGLISPVSLKRLWDSGLPACSSVARLCPTLRHPRDSSRQAPSGQNTGVGCHFLLQGVFLTQGSNLRLLGLLHWRADCFTTVPTCVNKLITWKGQLWALRKVIHVKSLRISYLQPWPRTSTVLGTWASLFLLLQLFILQVTAVLWGQGAHPTAASAEI